MAQFHSADLDSRLQRLSGRSQHRHDFGLSLLPKKCYQCAGLVFNRGCAICNVNICKACFMDHDCKAFGHHKFQFHLVSESQELRSSISDRLPFTQRFDSSARMAGRDSPEQRFLDIHMKVGPLQDQATKVQLHYSAADQTVQPQLSKDDFVWAVFDVSSRVSFEAVKSYLNVKRRVCGRSKEFLIANNCNRRSLSADVPGPVLTASIDIQSDHVKVCITNLASSTNIEVSFHLGSTIGDLEDHIFQNLNLAGLECFTVHNHSATEFELLKNHPLLTIKSCKLSDEIVSYAEGKAFADHLGIPYSEVDESVVFACPPSHWSPKPSGGKELEEFFASFERLRDGGVSKVFDAVKEDVEQCVQHLYRGAA